MKTWPSASSEVSSPPPPPATTHQWQNCLYNPRQLALKCDNRFLALAFKFCSIRSHFLHIFFKISTWLYICVILRSQDIILVLYSGYHVQRIKNKGSSHNVCCQIAGLLTFATVGFCFSNMETKVYCWPQLVFEGQLWLRIIERIKT